MEAEMDAKQLRQTYFQFFQERGHTLISSAPLIPRDDASVLFTTAGMQPLAPYLMGAPHPGGTRLVDVQKVLRTDDIDEVGDSRHLTFFEMLGNWSLGDYGKEQSIRWSYEFLTEWLHLDPARLSVTCFAGDEDAPRDDEAAGVWRALGIPDERIFFLPKKDNWWGPVGATGPCGPDTEMFYDVQPDGPSGETLSTNPERFPEIWNNVFMQYIRQADGTYEPLPKLNVDTGMGLERVLPILQSVPNVYLTDLFTPIFERITALAPTPNEFGLRVVADHTRAAVFILAEGIKPGNVDQPYIARRLIRRAVRYGREMGIDGHFLGDLADVVISMFADVYPELESNREHICAALNEEEAQFSRTLTRGQHEFERAISEIEGSTIPGDIVFHLYDTYGFPPELTSELAQKRGLSVDMAGFDAAFAVHQAKSREGAGGRFRGGLAEHNPDTIRLHTATHLLHAALRQVLGTHVEQRGSNITAERLRFDFSYPDKLTDEQIAAVEALVNQQIGRDLSVSWAEMTVDEAKQAGAIGLFGERYGERVKVYTIGDYSMEICGGPHVEHTSELGAFKIAKEEAVGSGIRRIRAILR
jgi:alanyl-tRNA synthetase